MFVGNGYDERAKDKLAEYGADKIYVAEDAELDGYLVAPKAEVLAQLVAAVVARRGAVAEHRRRARRSPAGWPSRPTPAC